MTRSTPIPETVTLHVPFRVVRRGGRKEMHLPDGTTPSRRADSALVKALARAFRWKRMLESGEFATIFDLAEREAIAQSYYDPRPGGPDPARARHRRGDSGREAGAGRGDFIAQVLSRSRWIGDCSASNTTLF